MVFHMPQIRQAMRRRLFLRCSQTEVLRGRQASATLAEPFVEHVFWPMYLQYGQPQAAWDELQVEEEVEGFPAPEALISEALSYLGFGIQSLRPAADAPSAEKAEAAAEAAAETPGE